VRPIDLVEHFINWINFATVPNWVKLWGVIEQDMIPGNYIINIENSSKAHTPITHLTPQDYKVDAWNGRKSLLFKTINTLGGTARFIGFFLLFMGKEKGPGCRYLSH